MGSQLNTNIYIFVHLGLERTYKMSFIVDESKGTATLTQKITGISKPQVLVLAFVSSKLSFIN